jgi:hypothetical protein
MYRNYSRLKPEVQVHNKHKISSYLTANIFRLHQREHSVNAARKIIANQVTKINDRPDLSSEGAANIDKTVTVKQ